MQERDLSEYDPATSSSSKNLSCSNQLCKSRTNCKSLKDPCPYIAEYASEDTSSSGYLVEDVLHLASVSKHATQSSVQASVIIGCVYVVFSFSVHQPDIYVLKLMILSATCFISSAVVGSKLAVIWMEQLQMA